MTAETIHTLSSSIPNRVMETNKLGHRLSYNPDLGYDPSVFRFISSYRDLNFGWQYARMTAEHRLRVVGNVLIGVDEVLWRAHLYCRDPRRYPSPDIQMALALASNDMAIPRAAIEGMLLSRDATPGKEQLDALIARARARPALMKRGIRAHFRGAHNCSSTMPMNLRMAIVAARVAMP